jgi:ProP effector
LALLQVQFPLAFPIPPKPLKVGIFAELAEVGAGGISRKRLRIALRHYTRTSGYLAQMTAGAPRVGLDGTPCDAVSDTEAAHARELMAARAQAQQQRVAELWAAAWEHRKAVKAAAKERRLAEEWAAAWAKRKAAKERAAAAPTPAKAAVPAPTPAPAPAPAPVKVAAKKPAPAPKPPMPAKRPPAPARAPRHDRIRAWRAS